MKHKKNQPSNIDRLLTAFAAGSRIVLAAVLWFTKL